MRITQQMLSSNMVTQMNRNLTNLEKANQQVSTGIRINKPSDDPMGTEKSLKLSSQLADNEQYERNTDYAMSWMEMTEQSLSSISNLMQRASELGVQASNGTNSAQELETMAKEFKQLREELKGLANTKLDGKYIFNGQKTDQPVGIDQDGNVSFDSQSINQRISPFSDVKINVDAGEVFDGQVNLFKVLDEFSTALSSGDKEGMNTVLGKIEEGAEQVLTSWTGMGARQSRVESMNQRLKDENLAVQSFLSKNEDVDLAEAIMKLKTEESIYQASLAASAKVIQPSLLDFLR
ncbi:flagellar hook-associated protein FlgL [Guptibacillus hwajinpoensis]|uniref:flagellar hook-associated protein FlgL n=1 Tax=Guptibacillus hwajinpoensis TaxID=208199 RepID=UPI001CFCBB3B|nr:flagellar hook-associated protein FlgL [Pseudalkalibacillus hwajinpoensis]WLR57823.1 flagellar hook-associated protein FlgL [Pseudalkalibacillus hwajinpoensis]